MSQQSTANNIFPEKTINQRNLEMLKKYFHQAVEVDSDGKFLINSSMLQVSFDPAGVKVEEDGYEMRWVGKREAYHNAFLPTQKILNPLLEESKEWNKTENLLLRGDNLEALRLLRHSYFGEVKLIYIDPPYNTKNDGFIYNDNFTENQTEVLQKLGYDKENVEYIKNIYGAKTHSGWLSFIYPRLLLAKDLLTDDGIVFISIDDSEFSQLKILCDEIFGENNLLQQIVWKRHAGGGNDSRYFAVDHEYILAYAKSKESIKKLRVPLTDEQKLEYKHKDEHFEKLGGYKTKSFRRMRDDDPRENLKYKIKAPDGTYLLDTWKWEETTFLKAYAQNKVTIKKNKKNQWQVEYKLYLYDEPSSEEDDEDADEKSRVPRSLITDGERNSDGKKQLKEVLGLDNIFNNPKPLGLLKNLISIGAGNDDLIVDFFGGSGSTAEAVMQLNYENDDSNRKFILVQIPQLIDKTKQPDAYRFVTEDLGKPPTIFEIAAERIRRAGAIIEKKQAEKQEVTKLVDTGFRVFDIVDDADALILQKPLSDVTQNDLDFFIQDESESLTTDTSTNITKVLFNLLLAEGLPLTTNIQAIIPDVVYLADNVVFVLRAIKLETLTDVLNNLKSQSTPVVYITVYAPWIRDDNFMQGIKTVSETLGYSSEKLRLRGYGA